MVDVFIRHSSKDKEIAEIICNSLEANITKHRIVPKDIRGGYLSMRIDDENDVYIIPAKQF